MSDKTFNEDQHPRDARGEFKSKEHAEELMGMLEDFKKNGFAKPSHLEKLERAKDYLGLKKSKEVEDNLGALRGQSAIDAFYRTILNPALAHKPKTKLEKLKHENVIRDLRAHVDVARDHLVDKALNDREKEERVKSMLWSARDAYDSYLKKIFASDSQASERIFMANDIIRSRAHKIQATEPWKQGEDVSFMYLPAGVHTITAGFRSKAIRLTVNVVPQEDAVKAQDSLKQLESSFPKQKPFGCIEHKEEDASVWAKTFEARADGVYLAAEPSALGVAHVNGKIHRSWSPSFTTDADYAQAREQDGIFYFPEGVRGSASNPARVTGVAFCVGTLTNKPAFKGISPVRAKAMAEYEAIRAAQFRESDHPRGKGGKFAKTSIEAYGVKGMKSTQWRKTFKSPEHLTKWAEENSAEVHGVRDTEETEQYKKSLEQEPSLAEATRLSDSAKTAEEHDAAAEALEDAGGEASAIDYHMKRADELRQPKLALGTHSITHPLKVTLWRRHAGGKQKSVFGGLPFDQSEGEVEVLHKVDTYKHSDGSHLLGAIHTPMMADVTEAAKKKFGPEYEVAQFTHAHPDELEAKIPREGNETKARSAEDILRDKSPKPKNTSDYMSNVQNRAAEVLRAKSKEVTGKTLMEVFTTDKDQSSSVVKATHIKQHTRVNPKTGKLEIVREHDDKRQAHQEKAEHLRQKVVRHVEKQEHDKKTGAIHNRALYGVGSKEKEEEQAKGFKGMKARLKAHRASAAAHEASANAHESGSMKDHHEAMKLHAAAYHAHNAAGNHEAAKEHLKHGEEHRDAGIAAFDKDMKETAKEARTSDDGERNVPEHDAHEPAKEQTKETQGGKNAPPKNQPRAKVKPFDDGDWDLYAGAERPDDDTQPLTGEREAPDGKLWSVVADKNGVQIIISEPESGDQEVHTLEIPFAAGQHLAEHALNAKSVEELEKMGFDKTL